MTVRELPDGTRVIDLAWGRIEVSNNEVSIVSTVWQGVAIRQRAGGRARAADGTPAVYLMTHLAPGSGAGWYVVKTISATAATIVRTATVSQPLHPSDPSAVCGCGVRSGSFGHPGFTAASSALGAYRD
jgi:hypothetical protein